ncbi:MAG: hypothetical protein OFPI_35770 [Osedax symbiont Rs2]|nr:MAG: hypothetical protein OFPI_35770 [Osedax symbiont Rs2]
MLRKLGLSIAIASALLVSKVNALGLGEIRVKSALNEPLHAEIQLFQVKNLSPLQIKSRMADLNDFALSGLATQRALSDVRFQVRVRPNGTGRIILTSKLPVTEPFMNFLVEVNWPSGRLIREYTLLLDPPSYNSQQNNRNFSASDSVSQAKAPARKVSRKSTPKKLPAQVKLAKGQYYIRSKDTLWDVAVANRPNKRVTSQQMMVLIQRKNPQAFPNANINVMTANVVIDLPTQAEIDAFSAKEANTEVQRQTKLWKSGNLPKVVVQKAKPASGSSQSTKDQAEASAKAKQQTTKSEKDVADKQVVKSESTTDQAKTAADGKPVSDEKGMLNVLTPEEEAAQRELKAKAQALTLAAGKDSQKIEMLLKNNAELDVKLALSQESIDRLERDNTDLNAKLDTIAKQLEDINRLIMLKDEQLAALQDERQLDQQLQTEKDRQLSDQGWLDRLLADPIAAVAAAGGWLLAILAGILLLLRRRNKAEPVDDEKSEPSISLPDEAIDDQLQDLAEVDDPAAGDEAAGMDDLMIADDLDLDLDLDLDMDMDLDESLEGTVVPGIDELEGIDDDDLAAELEAQLNTSVDDDDEGLDMLDGIDSLEFDLGESDSESDVNIDLDAEEQAMAEFAAAMEEGNDQADEIQEDDSIVDDALLAIDQQEVNVSSRDEDLEIEIPEELELVGDVDDDTTVEELEVDISEIPDTVTSLDELEALEGLNLESAEDLLDETELALDLDDAEQEALDELSAQDDIEDELSAAMQEQSAAENLDSAEDVVDAQVEEVDQVITETSLQLEDDAEELSLDSAAIDIEEEESQIPMDDALDDLLGGSEAETELEVLPEAADESKIEASSEVLEEQLDELLNSTDDDIALEAVEPEFDTDNEEDIDLLLGEDGVQMKLDLARAYIEMGDAEGASEIIGEVMQDGDPAQQQEAQQLLKNIQSQ